MKTTIHLCIASLQFLFLLPADAKLREEQLDVPVKVQDAYGKTIEQSIKVTVFSDDANPTPAPVMVFNHGRTGDESKQIAMGRVRYASVARFFVAQGFIVAVPTRIGYGVTGGPDVEEDGPCGEKRFTHGHDAGLAQTLAALETVRQRPDVDRTRTALAGQSYGGALAIRAAAANPESLIAAINFAGGGGGSRENRPQRPCGPHRLERLFRSYGSTTRVPTLWLYAENDQLWGANYPREWFEAFREAGGLGEFIMFPPVGEDGHNLLGKFPNVWQPPVRAFLERHGFARPTAK